MQIYGNILLYREVSETSAPKYYYLYNAHRDVKSLIDSESNIAVTYDYDDFGNILSKIGDADNNITYNGYQYDDETGLYYLNARYYDSTIARFITEDTYGGEKNDPLSLNRYTYCMNNPLVYEDPTGHFSWKKVLKVVVIVAVAVIVTAAVVASAGTLGAAVASAAVYYGAGAAATGLATAATVGTYAVAGGVAITGLNRAVEAGTGKNVIADTVFKGNKAAYDKAEAVVNMAAFAAVSLGSAYGSNTQSKSKEKNTTTNTNTNTKLKSTTNIASKENTPKLSTPSVKTTKNGTNNPVVINNAKVETGRSKNNLKPDSNAQGDHSTYKRDSNGTITNYKTYKSNPKNPSGFDEVKGYDGIGSPHTNPVTKQDLMPHIHDKTAPGGVRKPDPYEIPKKPNIRR